MSPSNQANDKTRRYRTPDKSTSEIYERIFRPYATSADAAACLGQLIRWLGYILFVDCSTFDRWQLYSESINLFRIFQSRSRNQCQPCFLLHTPPSLSVSLSLSLFTLCMGWGPAFAAFIWLLLSYSTLFYWKGPLQFLQWQLAPRGVALVVGHILTWVQLTDSTQIHPNVWMGGSLVGPGPVLMVSHMRTWLRLTDSTQILPNVWMGGSLVGPPFRVILLVSFCIPVPEICKPIILSLKWAASKFWNFLVFWDKKGNSTWASFIKSSRRTWNYKNLRTRNYIMSEIFNTKNSC